MHAKYTPIHDGGEREVVKDLAAPAPDARRSVLALALVEETIHLRNLARLVVPPDEGDAFWVAHLQRKEEEEGLDAVEAAVDKVT
jgi:hypothetical protein